MPVEQPSGAGDEALAQAIRHQIYVSTWGRIRELAVELSGDRLTIHGYSPSYYLIQRALLAVREVFPSKPVKLDIQVSRTPPHAPEGSNSFEPTALGRDDQAGREVFPRARKIPGRYIGQWHARLDEKSLRERNTSIEVLPHQRSMP